MAEEIIIKTVLDTRESEQKLKQDVSKALNSPEIQNAAKNAGKKISDGIGLGIESGRRGRETAEERHLRRIEAIHLQSGNRLQQIEARKQAQIDVIRERAVTRELENQRKIERALQTTGSAVGRLQGAFAGLAAFGAVALFERIGRAAVSAAVDIDRQIGSLRALTGSAEAAQKRFQELFALAQKTPGLTTSLAATLDAQLRIFNVAEKTIDKLLPVIGRLNAISPLGNPQQFVGNLTQLISQNFEKQDLKELVAQSPIAGQLIKQIFNVDSPTNAEAIRQSARKLGVTSVERLAEELIKAGENNSALKNAVETLGGQFEKLQDRLNVALAPLGKEIANTLIPIFDDLTKITENYGRVVTEVFRDSKSEIIAVARELGNVAVQIGKIVNEALQLAAPGGFKDVMRETALMLSTLGDLTSGDFSGTRTRKLAEQFFNDDRRAENDARLRASVNSRLPFGVDIGEVTGFLRTPPPARGGGGRSSLGGGTKAKEPPKTPVDLLFFAKGREFDLAGGQRGVDDQMGELSRLFLQQQKDEAQAFGGIVKEIQSNNAKAAKEALEAQEKFNEELKKSAEIAREFDPAFRFMRGLRGETDATASAFERLGQSIGDAFGDLGNLLSALGSAVKRFFGDLLSATIRTTLASAVGPLLGQLGGGGGSVLGNLFRTPSFAGGGGITVPSSVSGGGLGSIFSGIFGGGGGGGGGGVSSAAQSATGIFANGAFARGLSGGSGFSLGGLLGGLASAAPLLGLGLGSGFGGRSVTGQILGAVGGGAVGLGASFGAAVFGAGGGLAQAGLAALGPIGLIGVPLLIGAALLGKAKQRRSDEAASGEFLTQALQGIEQLAAGVASGQIPGSQARQIFETQIIGTFQQQIRGLKTKSVVESRLTNQVRDLRNVFEARIPPLISQQESKAATSAANAAAFSRQIPEFRTGGTTRGGLALLHPGEKVLNQAQQAAVIRQSNPQVFERAGVPAPSQNRVFDIGGTMPSVQGGGTIEIHMGPPVVVISEKTAEGIYFAGAKTNNARVWTVKHVKEAKKNREL